MHSRGNLQTVYNSCRRHLLDPNDARYQIDYKKGIATTLSDRRHW